MTPMSIVPLLAFACLVAGAGSARAQASACPAQGVSDRFVCFETGDI